MCEIQALHTPSRQYHDPPWTLRGISTSPLLVTLAGRGKRVNGKKAAAWLSTHHIGGGSCCRTAENVRRTTTTNKNSHNNYYGQKHTSFTEQFRLTDRFLIPAPQRGPPWRLALAMPERRGLGVMESEARLTAPGDRDRGDPVRGPPGLRGG